MCVFHLGTHDHDANRKLEVIFDNIQIQHIGLPKYIAVTEGVTLQQKLTHKLHLEKTAIKICARVNLIQKLAGTKLSQTLPKTLPNSPNSFVSLDLLYCRILCIFLADQYAY
jgi:hypothetical protein